MIFNKKLINNVIIKKVVNTQRKYLFVESLSIIMKKDFISIIIPYHKKKSFFKETIKSINSQSYKNFEVIIVYDDSDKSELNYVKKILGNFKFKKKLLINNKTIGAGFSRNKGIKVCRVNLLLFVMLMIYGRRIS